ncbi:hypothetical protein [Intestinimonas sp.]|uniref:hypothetical protein n=1 Tax=Intestinimonas sp. TaxID=1965293 RepID=UPI002618B004|nr:hypothetical protein [Intestinimonas sp.]
MEKKTGHILSAVVVAAAIGGLFWQNVGLRTQVEQLSTQVQHIHDYLPDLRQEMANQAGDIRWEIAAQQSLFSSVETGLGYISGDLSLSVSLVPKELSVGETAQLSLSTGETAVLTDDGSGRLTGVLTCPLRESLEPVVILTDGETTRREVLPTLWTNELFTLKGDSRWEGGTPSDVLSLTFNAPESSALEPETVTVEVRSAILEVVEGSLMGTVEAVRQADGSWRADLSRYLNTEEEYDYDFWVSVTTGEGVPLRSDQPVADCQQNGDGSSSSWGEGDFALYADFGET